MVVTLGQQYNVGEKPTVIVYTYVMQGHQTNKTKHFFPLKVDAQKASMRSDFSQKQKQCSN